MTVFRDVSIKTKLSFITLLACVTALALACVALFVYERQSFERTLVNDLKAQAAMLAGLSTAALTFDDSATAKEMLRELREHPHVQWAVIFRKNKVFAHYQKDPARRDLPTQSPERIGPTFRDHELQFSSDIMLKGERLGTISMCADTSVLRLRLWEYGEILLVVFLASSLIALLLAARLQKTIIGQVQQLSDTARVIAAEQDYSMRVPVQGRDELGRLTTTFNLMLSRIEAQDLELRNERERFEVAVAGARDAIWDWNLESLEYYISPQWKIMLGYQDDPLPRTHESVMHLVHPDDRPSAQRALADYLQGRSSVYESEFRLRHHDGSYRWILARGSALRSPSGKPYRMAGSHTDITERKRANEKLEQIQKQLVESSRLAGMAEVATSVLHNVGNVLNSVNVSAALVIESIRKSKSASLSKAVKLLRDHHTDLARFLTQDPKGRHLPEFLEALAAHFASEQTDLIREMEDLRQNIEHIKQIVAMQQASAKYSGVLEPVSLVELTEDALRIAADGLERHRIEVVRQYSTIPPVMVDRHKVLQILINLISNAKQALDHRPEGRQLILRIALGQRGCVRMEVVDNGVGIPPDNLTRIFNHGFTTKSQGHGFGLHSGANAAKELGGSLSAYSIGPGCGATFTLELPAVFSPDSPESGPLRSPTPPATPSSLPVATATTVGG